jgi:hypothetical protein
MAIFYIPLANGTYETGMSSVSRVGRFNRNLNRQLSFNVSADNPPVTAGWLSVQARPPGSDVFEDVPNGIIDLTNPFSLLFQFKSNAYRFVVSGVTDTGRITITDVTF